MTRFPKNIQKISIKKAVALSIVLLPCIAFAQFSKRQVYLGGSLSSSLFSNEMPATANSYSSGNKNNMFTLSPIVGVFLNPKIAVGGSVGYTATYNESNYTSSYYDANNNLITVPAFQKSWSKGIIFMSFTRYYVPISSSFYFAAHGQINFTRSNQKNIQNTGTQEITNENPYYSIGVTLKPVFIFFPSPRWGFEVSVGSLGYLYYRYLPNVSSVNSFSLNAGSFSFGLAYYFAKK
jgi:hypothetical protein